MEEILLRIRKIFLLYLYDDLTIEMETKFSYNTSKMQTIILTSIEG